MNSTAWLHWILPFAKSQSVMWSSHQLFNTLVEIDDSLHIIPHWRPDGILMKTAHCSPFTCVRMPGFMMIPVFLMAGKKNDSNGC